MERATALAAKYNVDLAFVSDKEKQEKKEEFVRNSFSSGARSSVCQIFVSDILKKFFNVTILKCGNRLNGIHYVFLGRKSQVDFAIYVQDFLREHMMNSWREYQIANRINTKNRYTYLHYFWRGLSDKLKAITDKTEQEVFISLPAGQREQMGIVLYNEENARNEFVNKLFPNIVSKKTPPKFIVQNGQLQQAGYKAGQDTNIAMPLEE